MTLSELQSQLKAVNDEIDDISSQISAFESKRDLLNQESEQLKQHIKSLTEKDSAVDILKQEKTVFDEEALSPASSQLTNNPYNHPWSEELQQILETRFCFSKLRPLQERAINASMLGQDVILIMPAGGGKSLCYQLPALLPCCSHGFTLVVSPLVSLMEDQVYRISKLFSEPDLLEASDYSSANPVSMMLDSSVNRVAQNRLFTLLRYKATGEESGMPPTNLRLVYVTPEKIMKGKRLMAALEKAYESGTLMRIAIDEVHCISQYGNDFRPDYKHLQVLHRQFPNVPIMGVTATASAGVLKDIETSLGLKDPLVLRSGYNRPNLFYEVMEKPAKSSEVLELLKDMIMRRFPNQSGIIYCFTQRDTEDLAAELQSQGIKALAYHAGMTSEARSNTFRQWFTEKVNVIVATIAFGMGIDKSNVRFVIHHCLSKSLDNYYQESGRAGRDGKLAHCILLYRFLDVFRVSCQVSADQSGVMHLYEMLKYAIQLPGQCRRQVLSAHFSQNWTLNECNKHCDSCASDQTHDFVQINIRPIVMAVYHEIKTQQSKSCRVTAKKLTDLLCTSASNQSLFRDSLSKPLGTAQTTQPLLRQHVERIIAWLLIENYLQEQFHYTSYSTVSYLHPGEKQGLIIRPQYSVTLNFLRRTAGSVNSVNSVTPITLSPLKLIRNSSHNSLSSISAPDQKRPRLTIINGQTPVIISSAVPGGKSCIVAPIKLNPSLSSEKNNISSNHNNTNNNVGLNFYDIKLEPQIASEVSRTEKVDKISNGKLILPGKVELGF